MQQDQTQTVAKNYKIQITCITNKYQEFEIDFRQIFHEFLHKTRNKSRKCNNICHQNFQQTKCIKTSQNYQGKYAIFYRIFHGILSMNRGVKSKTML
jgi:hypothetical protein